MKRKIEELTDYEQVGVVGVDAGCVHLGDPCYFIKGAEWNDYLNNHLFKRDENGAYKRVVSIPYEMGHEGKAVVVSSGYGDGSYPVFVRKNKEGRIAEVKIVFIDEFEEDEAQ